MGEIFRRIRYLINRRRFDTELESDMEFHREMAARAGRSNFGNTLRMQEQAREAWGWTWLDRLAQDLSYAARTLARSPGFTVAAVLVLAIGIGLNVAAFSLFNMVALEPLPVRDPGSLVRLERRSPQNYTSEMPYLSAVFYGEHAKSLKAMIAVLGVPPMQMDDDLQGTSASFATANYFSELGTPAAVGRLFDPARESEATSPPVVVLSYTLWQHRFNGDPGVVGRTVRLNRKPATVIGVTPYEFASLGGQTSGSVDADSAAALFCNPKYLAYRPGSEQRADVGTAGRGGDGEDGRGGVEGADERAASTASERHLGG